ncbi:MAG: ribbon-helix-helix protein, CopG family [Chloroflexota bacterium]
MLYVVLYMGATRTQIYLTEQQRKALDARRRRERKTLAAVVRDAIDAYIGAPATADAQRILDESFGTLPNLKVPPRSDWRKRERRVGLRVRSAG